MPYDSLRKRPLKSRGAPIGPSSGTSRGANGPSSGTSSDEARLRAQRRWKKVKHGIQAQQAFAQAGKDARNRRMKSSQAAEEGVGNGTHPPERHTYPQSHGDRSARSGQIIVKPKNRDEGHGSSSSPKEIEIVRNAQESIKKHNGPSLPSRGGGGGGRGVLAGPGSLQSASLISKHIVVGDRASAMDASKLQTLGVTHVLNSCAQLPNYHPNKFIYMKIDVLDNPSVQLITHHHKTSQWIKHIESIGGRVLVHCVAGCSRSVTIVLMHLMSCHRVPLRDGWEHIKAHRQQMCPNDGFKIQLAQLELDLFGASSMVATKDKAWDFYEWNNVKGTLRVQNSRRQTKSPLPSCIIL